MQMYIDEYTYICVYVCAFKISFRFDSVSFNTFELCVAFCDKVLVLVIRQLNCVCTCTTWSLVRSVGREERSKIVFKSACTQFTQKKIVLGAQFKWRMVIKKDKAVPVHVDRIDRVSLDTNIY